MPDPVMLAVLFLLVVIVEASPIVRIPIGLLLAIALLASGSDLLEVVLVGAAGITVARLGLALNARRGRDRQREPSPSVVAQREALRRHLATSPAYARSTFLLAALPGMPAGFVFPLLGAMRAPLWPALLGTLLGRIPLLAAMTALFAWLGRVGDGTDEDAALTLGVLAVILLVWRTIRSIDWEHRAATGRLRFRESATNTPIATMFAGPLQPSAGPPPDDMIEGELIDVEGEEDDDPPSDDPPAALPPTGLAPS